jgi:hypothetical protein
MPAMKLALSRDGSRLAALDRGRIRLLDLSGKLEEVSAPAPDATDLVLFDQALWVVSATRGDDGGPGGATVRRHSLDLRETAAAVLPAGVGIVRAPYGAPAALWLPPPGGHAILLSDATGALEVEPLELEHHDGDALVPLSTQRFVRMRDGELALVDAGGTVRWAHDAAGARAVALGGLFEGRSVVALVHRDTTQHLIVLDQRDGRLQHRLAVHGVTDARFTALRGLAILRAGAPRLIVVDLRFGKVLRQHQDARAMLDLAVDDSGQHLVLRMEGADGGDDEVIDVRIADLVAGRIAGAVDPDAPPEDDGASTGGNGASAARPVVAMPDVITPAPARSADADPAAAPPTSSAGPVGPIDVPPLVALRPRPNYPRATPGDALRMLECYRQLLAALAARAVARGWDSGTIAFVDETRPPFEKEVSALVLGTRGLAKDQLRRAEDAVVVAHRALKDADAALAGRMAPLAQIAGEFSLSALAQHLLMLVAAPALWGELARLYGILANDEHRPLVDELLLFQLSGPGADRHAIARALDRDQPLVRHGLIRIAADRARPFAALAVDPLVLKLLRADPLDADLEEGVEVIRPSRSLAQLRVPRAELARVVHALGTDAQGPARLVVRGRVGSGRRTTIAALAAIAGRQLGAIDAARFLRDRRPDLVGIHLRRTALRGWIPMIDGLDAIGSDDLATRDHIRDILRDHPGPLAVRLPHDGSPPLPPGFTLLDLPTLTVSGRADAWEQSLADAEMTVDDLDSLAARFAIGPGVIERVATTVATLHDGGDATRAIEQHVRQHLASRLGEVATRVSRLANWSQVVLPSDIHDSILELIARIRHRRTVYDEWGFDEVMATSRGVTALFQGGPGTGKTLVAGAIANELGLDLYRIDLSRVMSKWIGETEQNLAKVFAAAEEGQAILLFDEADSLFSKRTEVKTSVDRYANLEVNYLLQRFDSFEGIAILTTNFGTAIDSAFKRRLSFRLTFPFPDEDSREQLWKAHLPELLPLSGELDLVDLARRYRMSGGYIRNAALRAAFLAAEERSPLTQDHLERAIRAEFREIGKLAETGILE